MGWSFDYLQRDCETIIEASGWQREQTGGSVYLRLTTSPLEQPMREMTPALSEDIITGGYWWRRPGPNCELVIAYQGVVAEQALAAAGELAAHRRDIGVLAITSADRLNAGWTAAQQDRTDGHPEATSHIEQLLADVPRHALLLTVIDGHPATLSWIGGVKGMRTLSHGVEHFGQTGNISYLYRHFRLDTPSLVEAVLSYPMD